MLTADEAGRRTVALRDRAPADARRRHVPGRVDLDGNLYRAGLWRPDPTVWHDTAHHALVFVLPAGVMGAGLAMATTWWLGALLATVVTVVSFLGE